MKAEKIIESLVELAQTMGYNVRKESGTFKGGACVVRDQRLILINRSMPHEAAAVILARALVRIGITDDSFVKPAVRDLIDRESSWVETHPDVVFSKASAHNCAHASSDERADADEPLAEQTAA